MFAVFRQLAGMMFFAGANQRKQRTAERGDAAANGKTHAGRILMGNLPGAQQKVVIGLRKQEFPRRKRGTIISFEKKANKALTPYDCIPKKHEPKAETSTFNQAYYL